MTGQTPSKLLLQREMRTKIPTIQLAKIKDAIDSEVRKKDGSEKAKAKEYIDKTRHAKSRNLEVGDEVLLTQKRKNKYSTQFGKDPMEITKINGSQIILVDHNGKQYTYRRNSSHVKKYLKENPTLSADDEDSITTDPTPSTENQPPATNPPTAVPTGNEANAQAQTGNNNNQPQAEITRRCNRRRTAPNENTWDLISNMFSYKLYSSYG